MIDVAFQRCVDSQPIGAGWCNANREFETDLEDRLMLTYKPNPALAGPLYGKEPWPLRFYEHCFGGACFNTLACSILYNNHEFGTRKRDSLGGIHDDPSGPPPCENWKDLWTAMSAIPPVKGQTFPGLVRIEWVALDGTPLAAPLDVDKLFGDRLVLHATKREDIREAWLSGVSFQPVVPAILLEVNDRTLSVYMRALVVTTIEVMPGNPSSCLRNDLILAWTRTY